MHQPVKLEIWYRLMHFAGPEPLSACRGTQTEAGIIIDLTCKDVPELHMLAL